MRSKRTKARFKFYVMRLLRDGPQSASEISSSWNQNHRPYVTPREVSALLRSEVKYFERIGNKWYLRCNECVFGADKIPMCLTELPEIFESIRDSRLTDLFNYNTYEIILYWLPCKIKKPKYDL